MGDVIFILFLCAPALLAWRLIAVQRRLRAMPRKAEPDAPFTPPYTDQVKSAGGLVFSKSFEVNDKLLAASRRSDEPSDVKNLQGQR